MTKSQFSTNGVVWNRINRFGFVTVVLAVLIGQPAIAAAPVADFFVSPLGNDTWSGSLAEPMADHSDGPFATLQRARDAVRQLSDERRRKAIVLIRGGTYRLTKTVVFSLEDSVPEGTTTYAAYPGEKPVFSSGRVISGWQRPSGSIEGLPPVARDKVWVAKVASLGAFRTLYDAAGQLPRARGDGFSQMNTTPRGSKDFQTVQFPVGAVREYSNLSDVELRIVPSHFWTMNLLPVASIDENTCTLKTAAAGTYPLGRNGMTDRENCWIENALEVLDAPGEWVLLRAQGTLVLWPRTACPPADIVAPALTELIRIEGKIDYEGPEDEPVRGLAFRGLTFTHGDRLPWNGRTGWGLQHDWELFDKPTGLVRFRGAENCAMEDCEFTASGHTAVRLDLHAQNIRVVGNHIHHIGGVGVLLAGYGPGTKNVNRRNEVSNNYIHDLGREYWGSGAIFAWQSGENHIAWNHIHHTPYTAILSTGRIIRTPPGPAECSRTIRWNEVPDSFARGTWAEREPFLHARKNLIEGNDIHNAMEMLGDGNGIYVSGSGGGTVVRGNYCHDCDGPYMNAVIRCDDDQHGTRIEGNICCRIGGKGEGIISKGDNDLINNVVADLRPTDSQRGFIVFPYGDITGTTIERNVLLSCQRGQTLYYCGPNSRHGKAPQLRDTKTDHNVYFCTEEDAWAAEHLRTQRAHDVDRKSLETNPDFVDIDAGDFRFSQNSPAVELGIQPFDTSKAGLRPPYRERFLGRRVTTRISPRARTLREPIEITIISTDSGAEIRYTLDGFTPTHASRRYGGPFVIKTPVTIRAKSFGDGISDLVGARVEFSAPPAPIVEDFESIPIGGTPPNATVSQDAQRRQYCVRVTDEQAADGRQSLRVSDGPGQKAAYMPHVFYRREFDDGRQIGRFAVRVDEATSFYYQWRHYENNKYVAGPTVTVGPGGVVTHAGRRLLVIPVGEWVRFETTCPMGDDANGTFEMRVWLPGQATPKVFPGLYQSKEFSRLDWVGIASRAETDAVYYIDNFEIRPPQQ